MKTFLLLLSLSFLTDTKPNPNPESMFDFWVGDWELTWKQADGTEGHATNHIIKILDGKVIQENFEIIDGNNKGFKGMSVSTYNPNSKSWHQAWVDSQGGYYNFIGEEKEGKKIFKTIPREGKDGKIIIQRMIFYDFTENGFTWDWEASFDGGKTWKLNWQIFYKKAD